MEYPTTTLDFEVRQRICKRAAELGIRQAIGHVIFAELQRTGINWRQVAADDIKAVLVAAAHSIGTADLADRMALPKRGAGLRCIAAHLREMQGIATPSTELHPGRSL